MLSISFGLKGQEIVEVKRVGDSPMVGMENISFYTIPRTVIGLKVYATQTITKRGAYFAYAEEFLGIKNVPLEDNTEWQIDSAIIFTVKEPDPGQYYVVKAKKNGNLPGILDLTNIGLIMDPVSALSDNMAYGDNNSKNLFPKPIEIEPSIQNFYTQRSDTFYKTILKDSIFLRIPVIKTSKELKTIGDKAREAADVIIKIRQRKYEVLMAEDEALPEVKAMKYSIEKLSEVENEFMTLFTGRQFYVKKKGVFYFTPNENSKDFQFEMFRFSKRNGFSDKSDITAQAVLLELNPEGQTKMLSNWIQANEKFAKNQLLYRIPDIVSVSLLMKGELLVSRKILVYQFGVLIPYNK